MANRLITDTEIRLQLKLINDDENVQVEKRTLSRNYETSRRHLDEEIKDTRRHLQDIKARTRPMSHNVNQIPCIRVSSETIENDSSQDGQDTTLTPEPGIRSRTLQNMRVSSRLSRSLERIEKKRERRISPHRLASPTRPVSSRSLEDLERAACVLKNTEHERKVLELLSTVHAKDDK